VYLVGNTDDPLEPVAHDGFPARLLAFSKLLEILLSTYAFP